MKNEPGTQVASTVGSRPIVEFDFDEFRDLLDGEDISEDQERELLQVLFSILCQFVELGYAVDICGHFEKTLRSDARPDPVALEST